MTEFDIAVYSRRTESYERTIKKMWEKKMQDIIARNPDCSTSIETYMNRELSKGGSFYDVYDTYSRGNNKFFLIFKGYSYIKGFLGISRYSGDIYEINKIYMSKSYHADNSLIKIAVRYYIDVIKNSTTELQAVVESKNKYLLGLMVRNKFVEFRRSRSNANVYLRLVL